MSKLGFILTRMVLPHGMVSCSSEQRLRLIRYRACSDLDVIHRSLPVSCHSDYRVARFDSCQAGAFSALEGHTCQGHFYTPPCHAIPGEAMPISVWGAVSGRTESILLLGDVVAGRIVCHVTCRASRGCACVFAWSTPHLSQHEVLSGPPVGYT